MSARAALAQRVVSIAVAREPATQCAKANRPRLGTPCTVSAVNRAKAHLAALDAANL